MQSDLFDAAEPEPSSEPAQVGPGDAADRRLASTCFDQPIMLEAGAGTGKTATLVARIVHWCLGVGWEEHADAALTPEEAAPVVLRRLAAITFTEAAAVEMSNRISAALAWFQSATAQGRRPSSEDLPPGFLLDALPADPALLHQRAGALRGALDQLNVSTIHAFCRRLLAAHPLEVGLDPGFEVDADSSKARLAVRSVLEEFLREAWGMRSDERLIALARKRVNPGDLEEALLTLVGAGARAADLELDPLRAEVCDPLAVALDLAVQSLGALDLAGLRQLPANSAGLCVLVALDATGECLQEAGSFEDLCTNLTECWSDKAWSRLEDWAGGKFNKTELKKLEPGLEDALRVQAGQLREALGPLRGLDLELLGLARPLLAELLGGVEQELRRRGIASFSDLLALARDLLEQHPGAARVERLRLSQLLVDEFQDTDSVQCAVVRQLALEGPPEERPGLFLVGDPKQSIFAWRSADLGAYDAFGQRIVAAGGVRLKLTHNFRSRAAILEEVERAVEPVMEQQEGVQPEFISLEPGRKDAHVTGPGPSVEYWVSWPAGVDGVVEPEVGSPILESYRTEARAIAEDVRAAHTAAEAGSDEGRSWRSSAILFRGLSQVEPYLDCLRELGIPYQVKSDRKYYQRREVVDAAALVQAVLDPTDMLALVALMRSPMVGAPDAALPSLWAQGLPGKLLLLEDAQPEALEELDDVVRRAAEQVPADLPGLAGIAGWEQSLIFALHSLADLRAAYRTLSADAWIERLRGLFLPEVVESARFLGGWRVANLERFFRELELNLAERSGDQHAVLRALRLCLAGDDRVDPGPAADSGVDAVQILTIHGAKGLEFDTVYLAQTHMGKNRGSKSAKTMFSRHQDGVSYSLLGAREPSCYRDEQRRALAGQAERVRLLYVALTRAENRLVVLGGFPLEGKRPDWRASYNFSNLLEGRVATDDVLEQLSATLEQLGPSSEVDGYGVRWLVPATVAVAGEAHATQGSRGAPAPELGALDALARTSAQLVDERGRAATRMQRAFDVPASQLGHTHVQARAEDTGGLGPQAAMAVGTALHRVLELATLGADPDAELARWRPRLADHLRGLVSAQDLGPALERAEALLEGLGSNGLLARLLGLGEHVLARELAVLVPGTEDEGPVGYVSGTIDLLYRDAATGALVVCDYKTDLVEGAEDIAARAQSYASQGAVYVRAVREALGLAQDPRFELWFLHAGEIVPTWTSAQTSTLGPTSS